MHSYHLDIAAVIVDHTRDLHGNQDDGTLKRETDVAEVPRGYKRNE